MMDFWIVMLSVAMIAPLIFWLLGFIDEYDEE